MSGNDVTATLVEGPTSLSGAYVYYTLKGGTDGQIYEIEFESISTAGAKPKETLFVEVKKY